MLTSARPYPAARSSGSTSCAPGRGTNHSRYMAALVSRASAICASVGQAPARAATVRRFSSMSPSPPVWRSAAVAPQAAWKASGSASTIAAVVSSQASQSARGDSYTSVPNRSKTTARTSVMRPAAIRPRGRTSPAGEGSRRRRGRRAAGSRGIPLLREDPVERDVLIPEVVPVCLAEESLLPKAEALGDRSAPRVLDGDGERHAVASDGREEMVDQRGARAGHVPPALVRRADPVTDRVVAGDRVRVGADDPDEVAVDHDPERIETIVGHGLFDERACRVDGRRLGPEHPRAKAFAIGLDDDLQDLGIGWIESSELETVADVEERATHGAAAAAAAF